MIFPETFPESLPESFPESSAEAEGEAEGEEALHYVPAAAFGGEKKGFAFKTGPKGLGYYVDIPMHIAVAPAGSVGGSRSGNAATESRSRALAELEGGHGAGDDDMTDKHHWGQALQYLDRALVVAPTVETSGGGSAKATAAASDGDGGEEASAKQGSKRRKKKRMKVTLLAKREGHAIKFSLREGVGQRVGKAPWKVEWGGGASVRTLAWPGPLGPHPSPAAVSSHKK